MTGIHRRPIKVALVAGIAVIVMGTSVVLGATVATNGGSVTNVRTKTADDSVSTFVDGWEDIPGMSLSVAVPANQQAMFIITFSADTNCFGPTYGGGCFIRALFDGAVVRPGFVRWDTAITTQTLHRTSSMQFVAGPAGPGTHTVKVQFESVAAGTFFYVASRTLTVLRAQV